MRTLAVIVTYNPTEGLLNLIQDLRGQVDQLVVADNGSGNNPWLTQIELNTEPWIQVVRLGKNLGIARGLNEGVSRAMAGDFEFLLTLDQDSRLPAGYVQQMIDFLAKHGPAVGMVAPDFVDVNSGTHPAFRHFVGWKTHHAKCDTVGSKGYIETHYAITSGAMYPVKVFAAVGLFREDFFIDHVDTEHAFRLRKMGYRVLINCAVCMEHAIGRSAAHRFMGRKVVASNHSPLRRYYYARNLLKTGLLYSWGQPALARFVLMNLVAQFVFIALYEKNRLAKLAALLRGLWHGVLGRMGPA